MVESRSRVVERHWVVGATENAALGDHEEERAKGTNREEARTTQAVRNLLQVANYEKKGKTNLNTASVSDYKCNQTVTK